MARRQHRVLVLMHEDLVPPKDFTGLSPAQIAEIQTETDVLIGLGEDAGHQVKSLGLFDELAPLRRMIQSWSPHIVFNLLEEFRGQVLFDQNVVSYLQLLGIPYTGCNPRGLLLARDKALSKKIIHYHRIRTPRFAPVRRGRKARRHRHMAFPLIVKSLVEEGSVGIAQASVVHDDEALAQRVAFLHDRHGTDVIIEEFIAGREIYVGVLGNKRLTVLPPWELFFDHLPADARLIATRKAKWDEHYQKRVGLRIGPAELPADLHRRVVQTAKRIYRILELDGYARLDFRLAADERLFFLEANPNPDIGFEQEFAEAAAAVDLDYARLLNRLLNLGLRRARE